MPVRKMRVDVFDGQGNRYTITFQGLVTRDKAIRLLDLVELLGGMPTGNSGWNRNISELSKFEKVHLIIDQNFPLTWFSSRDLQSEYEEKFKELISLSTVSTYLSRMVSRGLLVTKKKSNRRRFKMNTGVLRELKENTNSIVTGIRNDKP